MDHSKDEDIDSRTCLERQTEGGKSPVGEIEKAFEWHQSRSGHVEPGLKQEGPPSKPKYYLVTDSV